MGEPCVAVECVSNYPLGKSALEAVAPLPLGVDALGMTSDDAVLQSGADRRGGGASAAVAAGLFQETGADIGLCLETRTVSAQDPSHGQGVTPGPTRGNENFKGSAGFCNGSENTNFYSHVFLFRFYLPAQGNFRVSQQSVELTTMDLSVFSPFCQFMMVRFSFY